VWPQVTAILGKKMETHNEVFYNNLLSIPFVCGLILLFGEHTQLQARLECSVSGVNCQMV
jgi:hypothetical protein